MQIKTKPQDDSFELIRIYVCDYVETKEAYFPNICLYIIQIAFGLGRFSTL